jgi:2-methylisocitrate lyase-like PEP mutase family enzyme
MLGLEAAGLKKLDNYQNFARAFRVPEDTLLMADTRPNAARLTRADDLKARAGFDIVDFGPGLVRTVLYGIYQLSRELDADVVLEQMRGMVESYYRKRDEIIEIAEYLAAQRGRDDDREGRHAAVLAQLVRNERLG